MPDDAMTLDPVLGEKPVETSEVPPGPDVSLSGLMKFLSKKEVWVGALILGLLILVFHDFFKFTLQMWLKMDSYYQHGPLVPLGMAYILWVYREKINLHPPKPTMAPLVLVILFAGLGVLATWTYFFDFVKGWLFLGSLCSICWMFFGFKRAWAMAPALFFSITGLPMWGRLIDENTTQLQLISTKGAYEVLKLAGFNPYMQQPTVIQLDKFVLNVAAACSGMKLTLAMIASVVFVVIIARLKWWKNLILIAMALPLAAIINSLRVAAIGMVGNEYGREAGMWFHDYGSYLFLALAFYVLYWVSKRLGWNV